MDRPVSQYDDFMTWLRHGITSKFCSMPFCETHEGAPLSKEESDQFDNGDDPCLNMVRLRVEIPQ